MNASLEMMIGLMVLLIVLSLALIAYLVRGLRRGRSAKARRSQQDARKTATQQPPDGATLPAREPTETAPAPITVQAPAEEPSAFAAPVPVARQTETAPEPDSALLMQVWQNNEGVLVVEIDGQQYRHLYDIREGAVGRQLLETINRLVAFSKGQETRAVPPTPSAMPTAVSPSSDASIAAQSQAIIEQMQEQTEPPSPKRRITADPVPFRGRGATEQLGITLNLADEIDRLLQVRVSASPEYRQHYIHVTDAPDRALRFEVDGTHYNSLDDVPDPGVQSLIRAAITDWESRR